LAPFWLVSGLDLAPWQEVDLATLYWVIFDARTAVRPSFLVARIAFC